MVILRNIIMNKEVIECDYYPEGGELYRHMKVDIHSGEIIENTSGEREKFMAIPHVRKELFALSSLTELPNERTLFWY